MPRKSKQVPEGSFYRDLGRNLGAARIAASKSQMEIAEHLDVTYQQVQKYERGTDRITIHRLISLAAFLEVPLLQFIAPSESDSEFQSLFKRKAAPSFSHFALLRVDAAWPRLRRAFRTAPVSRQTVNPKRFVTNRAFPHALPPSPGLSSALCPVPPCFFPLPLW
jgi:transcriptional regulator with XRE-family HTH domain